MNKRGLEMPWAIVITIVILLIVAFIVVFMFREKFQGQTEIVSEETNVLECMRYGNTREQCLNCLSNDGGDCNKELDVSEEDGDQDGNNNDDENNNDN